MRWVGHLSDLELAQDIVQLVNDRLFDDTIDTVTALVTRKKALAHPLRYSILYLLYEAETVTRKELVEVTDRDDNDLQHHLRSLLEANLIGKVPAPPGEDGRLTYYQITNLGEAEIRADITRLKSEDDADLARRRLAVPQSEGETPLGSFAYVGEEEVARLASERQNDLRESRRLFEQTAAQSSSS